MIPTPTLTIIPDFTEPPRFGVVSDSEMVRIAQGTALEVFPEMEPTRIFGHRFKLTTRAEIEAMKAFFLARGGRCEAFRLPSWRDELELISSDSDTITVTDPGTADGNGDAAARWLFICDGTDLLITRWTSRTDNGATWTYRLADPLTFTPTPGKAMVGYAHLVRFSDDRLRLIHRRPYVAEGEISFRAPRQWSAVEETVAVQALPFNESQGFSSGAITADALLPIEHRVAYALGPVTIRTTHAPDTRWACWLGSDGIPRLKTTVGTITLPDATGAASALFPVAIATNRLSLAFKHSGAEFIAFQDGDGDGIELRWWNGAAAQSEAWDGYDPVVVNNWFTHTGMASGDAEIVCYYLKPGDARLYARHESDGFATERIAATLPARPIELRGTTAIDSNDLLIGDASYRLITLA